MSQRVGFERWMRVGTVGALLALGCNDSSGPLSRGGSAAGEAGAPAGDDMGDGGGGSGDGEPQAPEYVMLLDAFAPAALVAGGNGEGGAGPQVPLGPPYGTSTNCGDGIVGADAQGNPEECDDGQGGAPNEHDACTDECQTRDQRGGPLPPPNETADRYLGAGRHPVAGLEDQGFITTYVNAGGEEPAIGATLFNIWGQTEHYVTVSAGAAPIYEANPVAAGLPGGGYAVAWGDFDGDGSDLGVALRRVASDGELGALRVANTTTEFSQLNPDMIWTGTELVVAWEDYSDALNGPDLRVRTFDSALNATSDELSLAATSLPEAAVALAPFNGGWAAAYREGADDGSETIVVKVGSEAFRIGPVFGGPLDDRPALVELDETHLLVVVSAGEDPAATGLYNVPRLRYAVVDIEATEAPDFASVDPLDDVFTRDSLVSHSAPSLAMREGDVFLAWRSEARPGDAAGDQIWLKRLLWNAELETPLDLAEVEALVPRLCEGNVSDQRRPALAPVELPPHGALAVAWDDYGKHQGDGEPDVAVHYAPLQERPATMPSVVTEDFLGMNGAAWPANWSHVVTTNGSLPVTIEGNEGRVYSATGGGTALSYINDHKALDVEMVTKVRWILNSSRAGFVARMTDTTPPSYLAGRVGSLINDVWRLYAVVANTSVNPPTTQVIDIKLGPSTATTNPFAMFINWSQDLDFLMRFRVQTAPAPATGIFIGIKIWLADVAEPVDWTISETTNDPTIVSTFGSAPGRFGLLGNNQQANRQTFFDDFRATFFEGTAHGDLSLVPSSKPLLRRPAGYRQCQPGSECALDEGCCTDGDDCASGSCQSAKIESLGLGSHARACGVEHCADEYLNGGETRLNCGGPDCAPCSCTSAIALGVSGYCNATNGCLCGIGEGGCSNNNQCLPGLVCKPGGYKYGLPETISACQPFHCLNRALDDDLGDPAKNETGIDCGGECGTCYVDPVNGNPLHCRVWNKCTSGHGRCLYDDECAPGLVCGATTQGPKWGLPAGVGVCVVPHCDNNKLDAGETHKDCGGPDCGFVCP